MGKTDQVVAFIENDPAIQKILKHLGLCNTMKTGHFYFGKKRTFLNWVDTSELYIDSKISSCYLMLRKANS